MITLKSKGNFRNTKRLFKRATTMDTIGILNHYGRLGVKALELNTPKDTGLTAASWSYQIVTTNEGCSIEWSNNNTSGNDGWCNIAIMLQYGHATRNGGWVQGNDYINPTINAIFEDLADRCWKEVTGN